MQSSVNKMFQIYLHPSCAATVLNLSFIHFDLRVLSLTWQDAECKQSVVGQCVNNSCQDIRGVSARNNFRLGFPTAVSYRQSPLPPLS